MMWFSRTSVRKCQRGKNVIIEPRHHRRAQLDVAQMPQKSSIDESNQRLRQIPDHDRDRQIDDVFGVIRGTEHT